MDPTLPTAHQSDALDIIGSIIGCMQIIIFTILLMCSGHFAFNSPSCPFDSSMHDCLGVFCLMLVMFVLSFILAVAIAMRHACCMLPWLIISVIVTIGGIIYLSIFPHLLLAVFGCLILCPLILTWYPLYKLYNRYRQPLRHQPEQRLSYGLDELYTLNRANKVLYACQYPAPSSLYSAEIMPSRRTSQYTDVGSQYDARSMSADSNNHYVLNSPAPGWRIGLYPKMSNKVYI
ncbi:uncharacterized protein LOC106094599 [Stomoxys calcitrans]|uniref:uncharacterized protein LOC106094599 n=1 Tax=Stomoxys calcitrans TaxID=35570 RepID=UPI0027E23F2D|nr:uncharacterized protein LOC106094599 [Stomoxys calcitrans]